MCVECNYCRQVASYGFVFFCLRDISIYLLFEACTSADPVDALEVQVQTQIQK